MFARLPLIRSVVAFAAAFAMIVGLLVVQEVPVVAASADDLVGDVLDVPATVPGIWSPPLDDAATMPDDLANWPPLVDGVAPDIVEEATLPDLPVETVDRLAGIDAADAPALPAFEHAGFVEGESVEVLGERTATTKVFDNPDGTQTARLFSEIVHVQDATGAWIDVDTRLGDVAGLLTPAATDVDVAFAPVTSADEVAQTSDAGRSIGFGVAGAAAAVGEVAGSSVQYPQVWQDTDLVLTALVDGMKSELVLSSADAPTRFQFPMMLDGLTPSLNPETQAIVYADEDGTVLAETPPGFMFDSNVDEAAGEPAMSMGVTYELTPVADGLWTLAVELDADWLAADERVFPVTVDPTATWKRSTGASDMYYDSRTGSAGQELEMLKVGTWNGGYNKRRSYLQWDTSSLNGKDIVAAGMYLVNNHSYSCSNRSVEIYRVTEPWVYTGAHTWAQRPSTGASIPGAGRSFAEGYSSSCPDAWVGMDITYAVERWANGTWGSYGVMVKAASETDSYGWKKFWSANLREEDYGLNRDAFRPYLEVHYNRPPVINSLAPANGTTFHALSRNVAVSATDPDGYALQYRFILADNSAMTSGREVGPWTSSSSDAVQLTSASDWNKAVYWQVEVKDNGGLITRSTPRYVKPTNSTASASYTSPGVGALLHDLTPTLKVSTSDAQSDNIHLQYQVFCEESAGCPHSNGTTPKGGVIASSGTTTAKQWTVPANVLAWNQSYSWRVRRLEILPASGCSANVASTSPCVLTNWGSYAKRSFETVNTPPGVPGPTTPGVDETLTELPVSFSASTIDDVDPGDTVRYQFQVAAGADGQTGRLATSGWRSGSGGTVSWTPPAGTLADGGDYSWIVRARDSNGAVSDWSDPHQFEIDLQLGRRATFPFDQLGPASVNLVSGNLVVEAGGPSFPTVGSPIGVGFTYNSRTPLLHGLTARFYDDANSDGQLDSGDPLQVRRIDRQVNYNWKSGSPNRAALHGDTWIGTWSGTLRVPPGEEGNWVIEATTSDDLTVTVGNAVTPQLTTTGGTATSTPLALSTSPTPIDIEFVESTGNANLTLNIRRETDPASAAFVIPTDWFLPEATVLPGGWSATGLAAGGAAFTAVVQPTDDTVVLIDTSGAYHRFTATDNGAWDAPDTLPGVRVTLLEDGTVSATSAAGWIHLFDVRGDLADVISPDDNLDPSAHDYGFSIVGGQSRLTSITDATGRTATLRYGGDINCPTEPAAGLTAAPDGMLCQVDYVDFGGTTTDLLYVNGHLARIVNPGYEITDLGYNAAGLLVSVRDGLRNDLIATGALNAPQSVNHLTQIGYDTDDRVSSVTAPIAQQGDGSADRVVRRYTYADGQTDVNVDGLATPAGFFQRAVYDGVGRMTAVTDAAGLTTTYEWDDEDRMVATTDPAGLRTTTIYDDAGFAVTTYGPAPAGWFDGLTPSGTAPGSVPTATVAHDTGLDVLAATWYATDDLTDAPVARTLFDNNTNWGTGSPDPAVPTDGFSGRLTGGIDLPESGDYLLKLPGGIRGRIYLDGDLVYDLWDGSLDVDGTVTGITAGDHELTIEYRHLTGDASLRMVWQLPSGTGVVTVPDTAFSPRLGLPYSSTDPDGHTVTTGYADPISGRATTVTVDPTDLALAEVSTYETPGANRYGRLTSLTLPSGDTTTDYSYYGDTTTVGTSFPCPEARGVQQAGALSYRTGPDPDRVERYVYDVRGNRVGSRVTVAGVHQAWRCSQYDDRGRLVSATDPSGKTTTHDYTDPTRVVTVYVDSSGTTRTTVAEIDWAGRPVAYTDEHGTTHRTVYDRFGRAIETHRQFAGQPEQLLIEREFDGAGRIEVIRDHASGTPRETTFGYDSAGRLDTTARPNDVDTTVSYDAETGHMVAVEHTGSEGATVLEDWTYRHTLAGRIASQTGRGQSRIYTYDGAGRLIQAEDKAGDPDRVLDAEETSTIRQYGYDANSNRISHTFDGVTGTYTYADDDRILSSPYATAYTYDARGNVTGWTPTADQQPADAGELRTGVDLVPGSDVQTFDLPVRSDGPVTVELAADGLPSATTSGMGYDTLDESGQPGDVVTIPLAEIDEDTSVDVDLTWLRGAHEITLPTIYRYVTSGTDSTYTLNPTAPGPFTAKVDWPDVNVTTARTGTVGAAAARTVYFDVSGSGNVVADLAWTQGLALENLDLEIYDGTGTLRGSSTSLTEDSERVVINNVSVTYPNSEQWYAVIRSLAASSVSYTIDIVAPETPEIDITVTDPAGTVHTPTGGATTKPEIVTFDVPDDEAYLGGDYVVTVDSDLPVTYRLTPTFWELAHADVQVELLDPTGTVLDTASGASGSLSVSATNRTTGEVAVRVTNRATDLDVPRATALWDATTLVGGSDNGSIAAGGSTVVTVQADAAGPLPVELTWDQSATPRTYATSRYVSSLWTSSTFTADGTGTIDATVDWDTRDETRTLSGQTVTSSASDVHSFVVTGNGTMTATLSDDIPGSVELELLDPFGTPRASTNTFTGGVITYPVTGTRSNPKTWKLRVTTALPTNTSYGLSWQWPAQTNMDVQILDASSNVLAESTATTSVGPDATSLTITEPTQFRVRVRNRDGRAADIDLDVAYPDRAQVKMELRAPDGTLLETVSGTDGAVMGDWTVPAAGDYTLTLTNLDTALDVPGYDVSWEAPVVRSPIVKLRLLDDTGSQVAVAQGEAYTPDEGAPLTLSADVTAGDHVLEVTRVRRSGTAELKADYPGPKLDPTIVYDANDHATVIDDGITRIDETLSPQGRVIERTVTDSVTGELLESVSIGYAGPGDNRTYEIRHQDGPDPIITYIAGPGGLLTIDTAGAGVWPLDDGQGHTLGTVDDDGGYTANPIGDEFGVMPDGHQQRGQDQLDWLGGELRHRTGDAFGLIRMGVRLYDPTLGRFLGVDPVDGGSANTYDYCNADPINCRDLAGEFSWRTVAEVAVGTVVGIAVTAASAACGPAALACAMVGNGLANAAIGYVSDRLAGERTTLKDAATDFAVGAAVGYFDGTIALLRSSAASWRAGTSLVGDGAVVVSTLSDSIGRALLTSVTTRTGRRIVGAMGFSAGVAFMAANGISRTAPTRRSSGGPVRYM